MTNYPQSYHLACAHLVAFGAHGGDTQRGRQLIASALWAIRKHYGRERAQWERRHLLFISGMFPVKTPNGPHETQGVKRHD